jgi:hypothetical protein
VNDNINQSPFSIEQANHRSLQKLPKSDN